MTAKHSPLPWHCAPTHPDRRVPIVSPTDEYVGSCDSGVANATEKNEANAAFIVAACNSHETLLEACKFLLSRLDDGSGQQMRVYSDTLHPTDDSKTVVDLLREAIQAAEGDR